jgi:hypothetical protein
MNPQGPNLMQRPKDDGSPVLNHTLEGGTVEEWGFGPKGSPLTPTLDVRAWLNGAWTKPSSKAHVLATKAWYD